jgi:hypothetical protein
MICRRWSSRRFAHDFRLKASLAVTMMSMPCCRRSRWSPHWLVCGWCRLSRMCSTKISLLYGRCRDVQRNGVGAGKSGSVISWCSGTIDGVSRCRRSPWRDRCRVESGDAGELMKIEPWPWRTRMARCKQRSSSSFVLCVYACMHPFILSKLHKTITTSTLALANARASL